MLSSWDSGVFLGPFIIGWLCWFILFGWQLLVDRRWPNSISAIFPFRFLKCRVYIATVATTLLAGFPYFAVLYSLPLRFQVVNQKTSIAAGIGLLPLLSAAAAGSLAGGQLNRQRNNSFYTLTGGVSFVLLGCALLSTLSPTTGPEGKMYGFQAFVGLGFGLTISSVSIITSLESSIKDIGTCNPLPLLIGSFAT